MDNSVFSQEILRWQQLRFYSASEIRAGLSRRFETVLSRRALSALCLGVPLPHSLSLKRQQNLARDILGGVRLFT